MEILKTIVLCGLSIIAILIIIVFEINKWPAGSSLSGILLGLLLQASWNSLQDLTDTVNWKKSQRKLERGGFIKNDTIVRISFAYVYRIKIGNKYLLVKTSEVLKNTSLLEEYTSFWAMRKLN